MAAAGGVVNGLVALLANQVLAIKPTNPEEWTIHNVYCSVNVEYTFTDGVNPVTFDSNVSRLGAVFHVTSTRWLEIKALAIGNIGYDGIRIT